MCVRSQNRSHLAVKIKAHGAFFGRCLGVEVNNNGFAPVGFFKRPVNIRKRVCKRLRINRSHKIYHRYAVSALVDYINTAPGRALGEIIRSYYGDVFVKIFKYFGTFERVVAERYKICAGRKNHFARTRCNSVALRRIFTVYNANVYSRDAFIRRKTFH